MFRLALALVCALVAAPALAKPITYIISGQGAGTIGDSAFDGGFTFLLDGDTANYSENFGLNAVDPLDRAVLRVGGIGDAVIGLETRLGYNALTANVFFSRATLGGLDLFDFAVDVEPDLSTYFAPIVGHNVFSLNQFQNVESSLGAISFDSSSDVRFSAVPLPATASLLLAALGAGGLFVRRRRAAA